MFLVIRTKSVFFYEKPLGNDQEIVQKFWTRTERFVIEHSL